MDEKQLQFLYNEYAKGKGFKDYSEFKGLMSSEGSRKLFFDDANKELGFKDYNEFSDLLGLKKKVGGEISSPTELPSVSREYLDKGQELADGSFLKKIGEPDRSQLVSQYKSPDISLTQKPKKDYYTTKLEKGLIFDKEGQLYAPSSEALSKDITAAEQASLKKSTQKDLVEKSREMPVVVEPTEPTEEQGLLLNLVSSLDRGFAKNFISNPMKGLGTFLQGTTKKVLGGSGEGDLSNALIKYGDYLNNAIEELTPQDQEYKDSLWDQAAQALGQVGSLVLTGGLTGAAGKGAALVAQAPKGAVATAASRIASQLSAPTSISAGLSMGQAEFDRAKQAGATDDQAFEAFYKNAVTGSVLETIPVMQFFKRFNKATAGGFVNYLKTKGVAGFTGGVEEMTTEILQQLYANKTAKDIYNINQSILDGVGSSGGIGFGVGFLLNAMGANARILRKQGKTQDAIAIENQIEQYEDNLKNPKVTSGNTAKDIVTQGVEIGTQKAVQDLDRDLANNVITPKKYQEGIAFAEKAAQVADKIPETVTGESRVKSVELLVERNDIKQANDNLIQQKQSTDEAYHAGIDEEIKANEERIKKIDSEVYNIAKKPSKEFGTKRYEIDGEEVSKEAFEALTGKPIGTKEIIAAEVKPEEVKVTEVSLAPPEKMNASQNRYGIVKDGAEAGFIVTGNSKDGFVKIKGVTVNEDLRGKGIAGDAYVKLGNSLAKEGVSLESDSFDKMEPSAARVWEKLADNGFAIKKENNYQFITEDVEKQVKNRFPVKNLSDLLSFDDPSTGEEKAFRLNEISKHKRWSIYFPKFEKALKNVKSILDYNEVYDQFQRDRGGRFNIYERGVNKYKVQKIWEENLEQLGYDHDNHYVRDVMIEWAKRTQNGMKVPLVDFLQNTDLGIEFSEDVVKAKELQPKAKKEVKPTETKASPLKDIESLKGEQPNIRTEESRKIVNAVRRLEGLEPYTGPLDKLYSALKEADDYNASVIFSKLNNLNAAVEAVKNLPSYKGFMAEAKAEATPIVKQEVKPAEVKVASTATEFFNRPVNGKIYKTNKTSAESNWGIKSVNGEYIVDEAVGNNADIIKRPESLVKPLFDEANVSSPDDKIFVTKPAKLRKNEDGTFDVVEKGEIYYGKEAPKTEVKPTEVKEEVKVEMVKPEVKKGKLEAYKAKYAPKPKEKIEPIKIEDNGKPIIAKDPAENDIAIAKLAKQDNPVEESSIKAIEGKAEGDIKAKLNEVIAEVDDKIKLATRIEMVAMNDLKTDEASFQNREGLNLKKVDDIVANYNPSEFDPIIYWTDASGQKYTLNHHRFAAAQKLKLDEIPAQKLTYPLGHPKEFQVVPATDKAEAIDFAINRSNANRSMETAVERAKALRKLQKTGTKEEINKFLEREGKNKTKIQNIAALNENGKTIDALKMFGDAEDVQLQKETEQRSDWIGEARRRISGLTNEHENEMFDFLMDKDASKRITSKADFISKVTSLAGGFDFNPESPLNLKRFKYQTEGERAYDERTGQLKSEIDTRQTKIDDLKARFSDPSRKDYIPTDSRDYEQTKKIADDQISKLNTEIKSFQQKLQEHYKEKGKYQGGIEQGGLFATKQITTEEISDMADIVKEFYDEGVIKLDDIKKEIAKELGYNSKALKDAVEQAYNKMVMEYTPVEISKGVIGKVGEKLNELGEESVVMLEDDESVFAKAAQLEQEGGKIDYDLKEANEQAKEIELEKDKNGNLIAPNGKKSNLNEVQWKLVRTPAFKNWAGEKWESILKDDNGEPRVVYHGTFSPNPKYGQQDFYTFSRKWSETNDTGFHFGTKEAAEARIADLTELSKKGYLFARDTERPRMLPVFLKTGNVLRLPEDDRLPDWRGYRIVQKIFDGIENGTLDKSAEKAFEKDIDKFYDDKLLKSYPENKPEKENKWIGDYLKKKGYDAIEYSNVVEDKGKDSYIVFRPEQVKLADGSNTTFGESGDIRFQYGKERIDSLINNIKINGQDISELLNYVVDSNDLLRRLDYLNKSINRNIELSKAIKDEKLSNPLKELRIGLLKYMDSEIEYRNNELKNAKQKGILNKDGDISDLKSRKIASYEKRLEKLKFYKDFIDNNLFNIKDLEINFKNIQYGKENLAPNGKKSNLTPEQYVLVRTPNFKKWFGDWENDPENASKVIDENGEPLVVYHGSIAPDIEVFDRELSKRKPSGLREMGFYFTTNKELAEFYSTAPAKEGAKNIKSKVYQSFLNLKTVKEFDAKGKNGLRAWDQLQVDAGYKIAQNRDAMDFLQNGKFGVDKVDGIIARNISDMESYGAVGVNEKFNGTVFLVFDDNKNSIKSATDNTGAFSTTDDRINYMAKPSGDILGFTYGKTIYLNASKINPNTPIHEGGHIWTKWVKNNDPRLYDRGMELVKNSKYLERAKSSKFYQEQAAKLPQGEREAYFQEEALAMAIGDKGAQFVAEAKKSSFKEWLDNLWDAIKSAAGFDNITAKELQNLTFDEFVKRAARDILSPKSQQELASINEGMAEAYKDLTINQKRQIINSKFDELLRVLKIEKICP